MSDIKRDKYTRLFEIINNHYADLKAKDDEILELVEMCSSQDELDVIDELLTKFYLFDEEAFYMVLLDLAKEVVNRGYQASDTVFVSMAHDRSIDGSQSVLAQFRLALDECGIDTSILRTQTRFDHIIKDYRDGFRRFVIVDDFIGSGQTALNHYRDVQRNNLGKVDMLFCFATGMREAVEKCQNAKMNIYCPWVMEKALEYYYTGAELEKKNKAIATLEAKLNAVIKETKLSDYSHGYEKSEALICRQKQNIPNNVFPIFWWKEYADGRVRKSLYRRVQDGY